MLFHLDLVVKFASLNAKCWMKSNFCDCSDMQILLMMLISRDSGTQLSCGL